MLLRAVRVSHFFQKWSILRNYSVAIDKKYDVVVIGGGSGGLACAKEASALGLSAAVVDYVTPSTQGTKWGLGGTCVNVGCIPKKLYHTAALLGEEIKDSRKYGWKVPEGIQHDWATLRQGVHNYIKSLNWIHRVQLKQNNVDYFNGRGSFVDRNSIEVVGAKGDKQTLRGKNFVIAVGGRPRLPDDVPGAVEHAITSDDIFYLNRQPGKTLVVGASYIALECAGFLTGLGYDTSVMIRSIPLRGFDQQMSGMIVDYMGTTGTKFICGVVPQSIEKTSGGKLSVCWKDSNGKQQDSFDTVLYAIGRRAETKYLNLDKIGVKLNPQNEKIIVSASEQSSVDNIYAIGDAINDRLELTPVAARTGRLLARRLAGKSDEQMDYRNVATTVFTPLEYGCVGWSEEHAQGILGEENVEVFHSYYKPHTFPIAERSHDHCYLKAVCSIKEKNRIVGLHILAPNAGEIVQGFAAAIRLGLTKTQLEETVGIHPTIAEEVVKLQVTKRSGEDASSARCCG